MRNGTTIYGGINNHIKWNPLALYGGGFMTGFDVGPGDVIVGRTDTAGSWIWDPTALQWSRLLRPGDNIAASQIQYNYFSGNNGCYDVAIAPSDANTIYTWEMGYIFITTNKGTTFTRSGLSQITGLDANDGSGRANRKKMVVDSASAAVCGLFNPTASTGGFHYTTNTGSTFTKSASVPAGNGTFGGCVAYDRDSTTSGTPLRHQRWGCYVPGNGLWLSTTGPDGTFTKDTGYTGGDMTSLLMFGNGVIVCCDGTNIYRRTAAGVWSTIARAVVTLALNYADTTKVIGCSAGGAVMASTDSGVTWTTDPGNGTRSASDVPWLATTDETYMTAGMLAFSIATAGKVYFCEGIGAWYCTVSYTQGVKQAWSSMNKGLRGMCSKRVSFTPSGKLLWSGQDRATASFARAQFDTSPSQVGVPVLGGGALIDGCDRECALDNENYQAVVVYGTSPIRIATDGGATMASWTVPSGAGPDGNSALGGNIAIGNAGNIVVAPSDNYPPFYTTNGGTSWAYCQFAGVTLPTINGNGGNAHGVYTINSHLFRRKILVRDPNNAGCFWFYCYGTTDAVAPGPANNTAYVGVWYSTDGGANFTRKYASNLETPGSGLDFYHAQLIPVPGKLGHLFWIFGDAGNNDVAGSTAYVIRFSSDYGATWSALSTGMLECEAFAVGAAAPGASYPTLYALGYTAASDNTARIIGRSTSFNPASPAALTWTSIGANPYPLGDWAANHLLAAHPTEFGCIVLGIDGASAVYGVYDDTAHGT